MAKITHDVIFAQWGVIGKYEKKNERQSFYRSEKDFGLRPNIFDHTYHDPEPGAPIYSVDKETGELKAQYLTEEQCEALKSK